MKSVMWIYRVLLSLFWNMVYFRGKHSNGVICWQRQKVISFDEMYITEYKLQYTRIPYDDVVDKEQHHLGSDQGTSDFETIEYSSLPA